MKQINPPYVTVGKICGDQKIKDGSFRFSGYAFSLPCDDGMLLYHTMTRELLHLNLEEMKQLSINELIWMQTKKYDSEEKADLDTDNDDIPAKNALYRDLILKWFLVPESFDEYVHASQVLSVLKLLETETSEINSYRIFTTTACNARCFYCYETGRKKLTMSKQTAYDVSQYIAGTHGNQTVKLSWFGGEPLMNCQAIRIICNEMQRLEIDYYSTMISNGYLFDETIVHEAVAEWKLKRIQITLDGPEEVYNRSKAYVHEDGSAYQRVMRNIDLLLNAGVDVNIRLNMCRNNVDDLNALADELSSRFSESKKPKVYVALLREYVNHVDTLSKADGFTAEMKLIKKLESSSLLRVKRLPNKPQLNHCMADYDGAVTIIPDGSLGKCEHFYENHLIGSIYPDNINIGKEQRNAEIAYWKERMDIQECRECMFFPTCTTLKHCPYSEDGCTEYDRMRQKQQLKAQILNEYKYKKANDDEQGE